MRVLLILMWKHIVVRVRRFIHTILDFIFPLMFFIFLLVLKPIIKPAHLKHEGPKSGQVDKVSNKEIIALADIMPPPHWIMYYPETVLTNSLMDEVGAKLNLNRLATFPGKCGKIPTDTMTRKPNFARAERGYFPYSNETGLPNLAAKMRFMEAIVIFQDMSGETWPERLKYTIRMKGDFGTESYKSLDDSGPEPHRMYGLKYGTFMRIQWAVDTSYIKLLTGKEVNQVVSLQEFYNDDNLIKSRNTSVEMVGELIISFTWCSLLLTFTFLLSRLLQERTSGIQELLRMVGVSLTTLRLSHVLNMWPVGLVYAIGATLCLKAGENPLIEYSSWILIVVLMFLYFNFVISMAFLCSYLLRESQYAGSVSALLYVIVWIPARAVHDRDLPFMAVLGLGFLPNMPMLWFWKEVTAHELYHRGAGFSNMAKAHTRESASILMSYIFMLLQIAFCYVMTWYLSLVRPGKFGQALPWNFCLKRKPKPNKKKSIERKQSEDDEMFEYETTTISTKYYRSARYELRRVTQRVDRLRNYADDDNDPQYWRENEVTPNVSEDKEFTHDPRYFEPAPPNSVPGIKIVNVSKMYPRHQALKNVSLEVYKGDITVLLGHNGAGKTTIMNIITGMTSATHGKVYVMGMDTVTQKREVCKHLGLCPQHNVFFGDLTVRQHIMFYTLLRGSDLSMKTIAKAKISTKQLAEKLGLSEKLSSMTSQLSGGMQRRVQLGCALAGGADVLILDEPTSGLDVETRRELWDLLLSLRGNRTVLLTTHYMEEADALGDRVAAIKGGELMCSATTMHLKKAVGTGYRLSFVTTGTPRVKAITRVVKSHVSHASLKERTINSLTYNLPVTDTRKFPKLFAALEAQRAQLRIESMAIGVASLEEVFMKLCSDIDTTLTEDEVDTTLAEPVVPPKKITGMHLYLRQFCVLLKRQAKYVLYRRYIYFLLQFLLPVTLMANITFITNNSEDDEQSTSLVLNLDMYGDRAGSRVMYHVDGPDVNRQDVDTVRGRFPKVTFEETNDIATAILRTSRKDFLEYNNYLAGVEVNDTDAKVLYTTIVRHAAPVALNLLSNMLASHYITWADGKTITTINEPIIREPLQAQGTKKREAKGLINCNVWSIIILFVILSTNINGISLPCKERETGTRHIYVMSGCPATLLWLAAITFHAGLCILTTLVPIVLVTVLLDKDSTIDQPDFLIAFTTLVLLGSMAFVAFGYIVSFNFGARTTSVILSSWIFLFGVITPAIKASLALGVKSSLSYLLVPVRYLCVPHTLSTAASAAMSAAHMNALCKNFRQYCPHLPFEDPDETKKCCAGQNPRCYFCFSEDKPGQGILILTGQLVSFMTLVILTERGFFNGLWDKLRNFNYVPSEGGPKKSETVRAEEEYVRNTITLPKKQIPDSLLANDLHKVYVPLLGKKFQACKGVSFSVKKGECFGLLGVNGAGKSTVFKMITAEEVATRGKIFANGHHISPGNPKYLKTLGYCPQFFGLDYFLSGNDNLKMILTLRGYDTKSVKKEIKNWIQIVGLEKYARNKVESYSGGCVRRMGAAAALCSDAELSLLDEPSAGVDPAARRRLWTALRKALRRQRSIIISSHSMDEMEALCHRIAIMAGGQVRALGTPPGLRAAHAQGYSVVFKLKNAVTQDVVDGDKTLNKFKGQLQKKFNCSLKDEHVTMLNYHINETMRLSDLFIALESLRREFPTLIEDYSVSETTLEEVFLSFAKEKPASA